MHEEARHRHQLAGAIQGFVGDVMILEPTAFVSALRRLTLGVPHSRGVSESIVLWDALSAAAHRGATLHHDLFHRFQGGTCSMVPGWSPSPRSMDSETVLSTLLAWGEQFSRALDESHEWPVGVRAAVLLQQRPLADWYISALAKEAATSVATLERSFKDIYGMTPNQYQARLRVRVTAAMLRADKASTEGVVLSAGWPHMRDFSRTLQRMTGWRVAALRTCSDRDFEALMHGPLAVPVPYLASGSKAA